LKLCHLHINLKKEKELEPTDFLLDKEKPAAGKQSLGAGKKAAES